MVTIDDEGHHHHGPRRGRHQEREGRTASKTDLAAHLEDELPKWWLPDDYLFVDQIPSTSTGKIKKLELRARFGKHLITAKSP